MTARYTVYALIGEKILLVMRCGHIATANTDLMDEGPGAHVIIIDGDAVTLGKVQAATTTKQRSAIEAAVENHTHPAWAERARAKTSAPQSERAQPERELSNDSINRYEPPAPKAPAMKTIEETAPSTSPAPRKGPVNAATYTADGKTMRLSEWAAELQCHVTTLRYYVTQGSDFEQTVARLRAKQNGESPQTSVTATRVPAKPSGRGQALTTRRKLASPSVPKREPKRKPKANPAAKRATDGTHSNTQSDLTTLGMLLAEFESDMTQLVQCARLGAKVLKLTTEVA